MKKSLLTIICLILISNTYAAPPHICPKAHELKNTFLNDGKCDYYAGSNLYNCYINSRGSIFGPEGKYWMVFMGPVKALNVSDALVLGNKYLNSLTGPTFSVPVQGNVSWTCFYKHTGTDTVPVELFYLDQ